MKSMCKVCDQTEGLCLCYRSDTLEPTTSVNRRQESHLNLNVDFCVANAHIATGLPQRKGVNPNCQMYTEIKYVKDVSCVGHLSSVNFVTNAPTVVMDPPRSKVTQFWGKVGSSGFEFQSQH